MSGVARSGTGVNDADYKPPFNFTGKLNKVTLTIDRPKLSPDDIKKLQQAEQTAAQARRVGYRQFRLASFIGEFLASNRGLIHEAAFGDSKHGHALLIPPGGGRVFLTAARAGSGAFSAGAR